MWTRHLATLALISAAKATDLLRLRADTIDRWFNTSGANLPATWTVSTKAHVPHPWKGIGIRGHDANIRATVDGVPVVIKARVSQQEHDSLQDRGGGAIYMDLLYLEALRGRPGIPKLFGAWFDGPRVSYVVADRGEPIGALDRAGKNVTMSPAFARAATARPLALARTLLECFGSWASAGYILDDLKPDQFTLDGEGEVWLVDGPTLSAQAPLGESVIRVWGRRKRFVNAYSRSCKRDFDCPATRSELNCCDAGARGAPESKGQCNNDGVCALLTEKTHVYDVAHRPWLLPFIADKATGPDRDLLVSLIRLAGAARPEDRPSFRELVDAIDDAGQSDLLARAAAVDTFFTTGSAPATWDVRRPSDVPQPWHEIGNQSIAKRVFRARVGGRNVVGSRNVIVKARAGNPRDPRASDTAGGTLYMELAWLAALRGRRGIPELHGAWFDGPRVTYVVGDAGTPIGVGPPGAGTDPTVMSNAFKKRAEEHPLELARSLFVCFQSWTSAGYLQDDFKAQQFTMDSEGVIYLVDGPRAFRSSPLGRAISRPYGHHAEKRLVSTKVRGCDRDADCPSTRDNHACHNGACEAGSRGAPEARGKCHDNACWVLSDKTHVWDVANRPWLLPFIAERAKDPEERDLLLSLLRSASAERPEDRPSFGELVDRVDFATLLARAKAFDAWWNGTAAAPDAWTVSGKDDVPQPWRDVGSREVNLQKHVYLASVGDRAVVVKTTKHAEAVDSPRGGTLYLEMMYLEILRGASGIPELLGAWFEGHLITYVVGDAGTPIGEGTVDDGRKARARAGLGAAQPTVLSAAFTKRAEKQPLALARSLLACFKSWASVGFVQDDFKAQQFTMDAEGRIFLVDGPRLLANAPLRRAMVNSWGRWPEKNHMNTFARACERDSDCPYSKDHKHCCRDPGNCEVGARGAPESKGKCGGDGVCLLLSERTHVYDVANRPWLLPFIADKATGDARDLLRDLVRRASAELPDDRPSFAELVDRIDDFENRRRDTTESVPQSPPRETKSLEVHAAGEAPDAKALLARASMVDHWFQTKKGNRPSTWTVWKPDQVPGPWRAINHHMTTNKKKHVYLGHVNGVPVVIKTRHSGTDAGGGTLYMEMLYMEVLRGLPGIPYLYGAWSGEHRVSYVVKDCGAPIGLGPSGAGTEPTVMSPAYTDRAEKHPIQLARSLLACFQSWASAGYLQDDFKAQQFTMDASTGDIYLVDGPRALYNSPLGQSMVRVWGDWRRKGLVNADAPDACENDEDCPSTLDFHSCIPAESCEAGARGAPESKGECRDGACVLISEKTHVFDSANRPWLLPFIAEKATGAERDLLLTLIRHASKARDEDRPSFAQMVDHLDRFENQKRGN